jgi:hypothetical protein
VTDLGADDTGKDGRAVSTAREVDERQQENEYDAECGRGDEVDGRRDDHDRERVLDQPLVRLANSSTAHDIDAEEHEFQFGLRQHPNPIGEGGRV